MHFTSIQLGRWHIPVFGVFAAIGLMCALALSLRTARQVRLDPEAVWNAGMTAVVSAFVISRVLLMVFNWHRFLQYPVLVMTLPSLTSSGALLTCFFMMLYLRWRDLPLLGFLDAMTPCAALLWMFLSAGRFVEGTREGMPTRLVWGMSDGTAMRVHPVELYTLTAASVICLTLLRVLKTTLHIGRATGLGLCLAGVAVYFIDFLRLPSELLAQAWLDPAQAVALAMIVLGAALVLHGETKIRRATQSEGSDAV